MNRIYKYIGALVILVLLTTSCSVTSRPAQTAEAVVYKEILGKSISDETVILFLETNRCSASNQFQLCKDVGIVLWLDSAQIIETIYLYLNDADEFSPYRGKLPYGLKSYDIMEGVEYKLNRQGVGKDGSPDEASSPDHIHYWAFYKEANMTIVYNSPFADGDATIYAILINH